MQKIKVSQALIFPGEPKSYSSGLRIGGDAGSWRAVVECGASQDAVGLIHRRHAQNAAFAAEIGKYKRQRDL